MQSRVPPPQPAQAVMGSIARMEMAGSEDPAMLSPATGEGGISWRLPPSPSWPS